MTKKTHFTVVLEETPPPIPQQFVIFKWKLRQYEGKYVILQPHAERVCSFGFSIRQYASFLVIWGMNIRPIEEIRIICRQSVGFTMEQLYTPQARYSVCPLGSVYKHLNQKQ